MSWHHDDFINLFSSIGSVAAAGIAAYAARLSSQSAKESNEASKEAFNLQKIIDEDRKNEKERDRLVEFLNSCAEKANKFDDVGNSVPKKWEQDSICNIVYSADSAKNKIKTWLSSNPDHDESEICRLFLEKLNFRVEKYLLNNKPVFNPIPERSEIRELLMECRNFFITKS